jgi:MFS superfamily sulfate permease-like transporter
MESIEASRRDSAVAAAATAQSGTFAQDLLASVVVFLVALPLCMGIAIASGAPPASGLITGIIGGIVVGALAGCPLQVSGPAAGLAVIIYEFIQTHGFEMLGPVIVAAGVLQLVAGAFKVGQLFRAIAPAVIYGMLAGIGVLIFGAQFHVMIDDAPRANGILNLLSIPEAIWKGLWPIDGNTHHLAAWLGAGTIISLLLWTRFAPKRFKWLPGALVGVVFATGVAQMFSMPVRYVDLPASLFGALSMPNFGNFGRLGEVELIIAAITLAFVASAETLLSAAAVDQMHDGPRANYNRELMSQGVGNTLAGLLGGLPMTGVIVRSATNVQAGGKTRRSAMLHGMWLLVLVAAAPQVLRAVPVCSLAAILVYTGYKLVNPHNIRRMIEYGGAPFGIYLVTLVMIVATDLLTGIVSGIVLSLVKVLYSLTHMKIRVAEGSRHVELHLGGAATFLRLPALLDTLEKLPKDAEVHVHFHDLDYIDHACLDAISSWEKQRNKKGAPAIVEWNGLMEKYRRGNPALPIGRRLAVGAASAPTPGESH